MNLVKRLAYMISRSFFEGERLRWRPVSLFVFAAFIFMSAPVVAQVSVKSLRCEMLENPIGIDVAQPRLSWQIEGTERGIEQNAYQIIVASSPEKLTENDADLWNSGRTGSEDSQLQKYLGEKLRDNAKAYWKVKVWTNKGESAWSEMARWSVGLLYYKSWNGRWIGFDRYFPSDHADESSLSARYFRKEFSAKKEIKSATAFIMGLGLYELYIDGKKVGNQVLAPSPTDYTQNIKYNAFDVTDMIGEGPHAIGVILGSGRFYAMRQAKPYKVKSFGFPKMLMQINIVYKDGSSQIIKTDNSWKGTADGPIIASNEYDGEQYDARKEFGDWTKSGFDDQQWLTAEYVQEPGGAYQAQMNPHMKVMQDLPVKNIVSIGNGKYVLDFGQNFSGWVKMRVRGSSGKAVTLRFAESLQEDGTLFVENLRDAKATDTYILKGDGPEEWEPRFTYHGFRYVEVSGYPSVPKKENFTGRLVYDDMNNAGSFVSSNALLNQIYQNSWWGIASNYKGMPVDCPQRNERQPWLGDRTVGAYGESFLFDNLSLYTKWLDDIHFAQKEDGAIPDVAPAFWRYYSDNVSWPAAYFLVADMIYRQTGDAEIIRKHYPSMKKYLLYMQDKYKNEKGIIPKDSYGDWCVPPVTIEAGAGVNANQKHPSALISTAYYYHLLKLMASFGELVGENRDAMLWDGMAVEIRKSFNDEFSHSDGSYGDNTLTDNLLAYYLNLVEESHRSKLEKVIVDIIENKNNGHLSTGVIGTQWLMRSLTQMGRADLAYRLATNTSYPSWGYMIENGATTIWELWNGNTAAPKMNSQNHVMMLGDLLIWYYQDLAGIRNQAGYKHFELDPTALAQLNEVNATYESAYGPIKSHWKNGKRDFSWNVNIPANTGATIYIPVKGNQSIREGKRNAKEVEGIKYVKTENGKAIFELGSGVYNFTVK